MSNTLGKNIRLTLFGESHGPAVGCVLDGVAPGIKIDRAFINRQMKKRSGFYKGSTERKEADTVSFFSGIYKGCTTGDPITIIIPNDNVKRCEDGFTVPRPGHADYSQLMRSYGFADVSGGGHLSGRLTAPIVAAGSIFLPLLRDKFIYIGTHIASCGGIKDEPFASENRTVLGRQLTQLKRGFFPVLNKEIGELMQTAIAGAAGSGDSLGGTLETVIAGMAPGYGEPFFDSVESRLSQAMFSVPSVKGVEFGDGFSMADMPGSTVTDEFSVKDDALITLTNHNGGINGGITNGMPVIMRSAFKPIPTLGRGLGSVNLSTMEPAMSSPGTRNDACILPRACVIADSMAALVVADLLTEKHGTDYFMREKFEKNL